MSESHGFNRASGLIVVSAKIFGPKGDTVVRLALDTGATSTLIRTAILVTIGYDPATITDRVQMTTGSGVEYAVRLKVQKIESLGREQTSFPVIGYTLPPSASVDGLLGLDFLRDRRLVVDFRKGEIILE